jgi:hypothetical protein
MELDTVEYVLPPPLEFSGEIRSSSPLEILPPPSVFAEEDGQVSPMADLPPLTAFAAETEPPSSGEVVPTPGVGVLEVGPSAAATRLFSFLSRATPAHLDFLDEMLTLSRDVHVAQVRTTCCFFILFAGVRGLTSSAPN